MTEDAAATPKLDVFLSYKREERDVAEALAKFLITRGYDVWWDAALLAGEDFAKIVHAELTQARAVVVLWSKQARNSHWVRAEARLALGHGTLINAVIDDMAFEGIPPEYSDIQAVRLGEDVVAFHEAIAGAIARKGTAPSQTGRSAAEAVAALEGKVKDAEFFAVIANSTQIVDFEEYLQQFSANAQFANMARRRIKTLKLEEKKRQSLYTRLKAAAASFVVVLGAGVSLEQFFGVKFTRLLGIEGLFQQAPPPVTPDPPVIVPDDTTPEPGPEIVTFDGLRPNMDIQPQIDPGSLYNGEANGSAAAEILWSTAGVSPGQVALFENEPGNSIRNETYGTVTWSGIAAYNYLDPYAANITFVWGGTATVTISSSGFLPQPDITLAFSDAGGPLEGLDRITGLRAAGTDIPIVAEAATASQVSLSITGRYDGSYERLLSADSLTLLLSFAEGTVGTLEISKTPGDERLSAVLLPPASLPSLDSSTSSGSSFTDLIQGMDTADPTFTAPEPSGE